MDKYGYIWLWLAQVNHCKPGSKSTYGGSETLLNC